jgi:hypothetical protein
MAGAWVFVLLHAPAITILKGYKNVNTRLWKLGIELWHTCI